MVDGLGVGTCGEGSPLRSADGSPIGCLVFENALIWGLTIGN